MTHFRSYETNWILCLLYHPRKILKHILNLKQIFALAFIWDVFKGLWLNLLERILTSSGPNWFRLTPSRPYQGCTVLLDVFTRDKIFIYPPGKLLAMLQQCGVLLLLTKHNERCDVMIRDTTVYIVFSSAGPGRRRRRGHTLFHSAQLMIPDFSQIFSKNSILILRIFLMILFVAGQ